MDYLGNTFSDDDDLRLFARAGDEFAYNILRIKHNDPEVTCLRIDGVHCDVVEAAWTRLGYILDQSTHIKVLQLRRNEGWNVWLDGIVDVGGLCSGLQSNKSIQKLYLKGVMLINGRVNHLAPFLSSNLSLNEISINGCGLGSMNIDGSRNINVLSGALLNRAEDTLEYLDLSHNQCGDVDLDELVQALMTSCARLKTLWLCGTGIGRRSCTSLARLLSHQETNLEMMSLSENDIDDKAVVILTESLAGTRDDGNTKLERLNLRDNTGMSKEGWAAILKLICNTTSFDGVLNSNHTLHDVGLFRNDDKAAVQNALGVDDSSLLRAALTMNAGDNKTLVARRKMIWGHVRGDLNLGESSITIGGNVDITMGSMPRILSWFSGFRDDPNRMNIRYHNPPLSNKKVDVIRLDSIYRIIRSKPDMCQKTPCFSTPG